MHAFQHAFDIALNGLLTELPAQLITTAAAAAAAAAVRARKKRQTSTSAKADTER
ncbi:hypothetical protein AB0I54_42300 [Streptomyces sp. NPDC050625]|uniref:hypothetical protein n=1 Tax=Streptomyces sp. NPDC050625 TaxID=3154629 RepID=UPI0034480953